MSATTEITLDVAKEMPQVTLNVPLAAEDVNEPISFSQPLNLSFEENGGQLSSEPQTNRPDELSIPRKIISSTVSSSIFHSECLRPILAGTYNGIPAYLVRLQFQLVASAGGSNRGWSSRVKGATIKVLFQDAPPPGGYDSDLGDSEDSDDDEPRHPSIVKTMPGPEGWQGQPTTAQVEDKSEVGLQLGWDAVGVSATKSRQRTKAKTGAIRMNAVCRGHDCNSLIIFVAEDSVDAAGIPEHMTIPLIVTVPPQTHACGKGRRFSMRVEVNARFGFWRHGLLADIVPVLGRVDEPLYFDPGVMHQWMEEGRKGVGGIKVVQWLGELEGVNLEEYFSLSGLGQATI
ncbi:hypothetical protein PG997_010464 [Apiospora hydei]|uniref:Uncharacterized protein n=1 Tax=Apiospora hydei TaxID=1337664 RepID=A0ABR1VZQ3_9PEZI